MKTLTITDTPREVYYSRTIQFSAGVEDKELTFRYWEDNNGAEFYILKEGNWIIAPEEYTWIEDLCAWGAIYEEMEIGETVVEEDC